MPHLFGEGVRHVAGFFEPAKPRGLFVDEDVRPAAFPVSELSGRGFEETFFCAGV